MQELTGGHDRGCPKRPRQSQPVSSPMILIASSGRKEVLHYVRKNEQVVRIVVLSSVVCCLRCFGYMLTIIQYLPLGCTNVQRNNIADGS
jgi:hypothetical protein